MALLFQGGELRKFLIDVAASALAQVEQLPEDDLLTQSVDDLVAEYAARARIEPVTIGVEIVDGGVTDTSVDVSRDFIWSGNRVRGFKLHAVYEFDGDPRLFRFQPSTHLLAELQAEVADGTISIEIIRPGTDLKPEEARAALEGSISRIRTMTGYVAHDVRVHNDAIAGQLRSAIEARRLRVMRRRELSGALGFPLTRRPDAPRPVPLKRKPIGVGRSPTRTRGEYRDEPALTNVQYEDAIEVVRSTLLAMERTPSVASAKPEEELRDQILVQLSGSFAGGATGETFVQNGKTDILIRVEDRHVFVAECKWWDGAQACGSAVDQLLSYLPWRDEKSALILFIDRKDATAAIEKAEEAIRKHVSFKRPGPATNDRRARRNFVLKHPGDPDREIHLAALFAVLPRD